MAGQSQHNDHSLVVEDQNHARLGVMVDDMQIQEGDLAWGVLWYTRVLKDKTPTSNFDMRHDVRVFEDMWDLIYKIRARSRDTLPCALSDVRTGIRLQQNNIHISRTTNILASAGDCIREEIHTSRLSCIVHEASACIRWRDARVLVGELGAVVEVGN